MTVYGAHAYCDESGNTGANLFDPDQPLFVMGGWLIHDGFISAAEDVVKEYASVLAPGENELHGVQLLKRKIGTFGILKLTQDLLQGCGPICQIVEKRVLLVGHVFDMFLKPEFNPQIPINIDDYFEGKRDLLEKVYKLPDKILAEFDEAYTSLNRNLVLKSLETITAALSSHSENNLADLMSGSMPQIDAIIEHHRVGRSQYNSVLLNTPNVASFHMFFQSLEHMGRIANIPKITLVHDENLQFKNIFPWIFNQYRDDVRHDVFKEGPNSYVFRGFESLKEFRFANSKDEPLLQAADVFVSSIYRYALNVYKGIPNNETLTEIARLFLDTNNQLPILMRTTLSDGFADALYSSVKK